MRPPVDTPGTLTVGEAARRAGLTTKAVRLYEARGLLTDIARNGAGYRIYSDHDVQLLRFIGQARAVGLGLRAIGELTSLRRNGHPPEREVLGILGRHLDEIDRRIARLEDLRTALTAVFEEAKAAGLGNGRARLCRIIDPDR
jgi:MerR family transcriptional regulator, copper efflux regulator